MNILREAILHACRRKENDHWKHVAHPSLRWFLTHVVGMKDVSDHESETKKGPEFEKVIAAAQPPIGSTLHRRDPRRRTRIPRGGKHDY
jgi:hypothetical protein